MDIEWSLVFTFIVVLVVFVIAYSGAKLNLFASIALALLLGLIALNLAFPPSELANQEANVTLWVYGVFEIFAIFFSLLYILITALYSRQKC